MHRTLGHGPTLGNLRMHRELGHGPTGESAAKSLMGEWPKDSTTLSIHYVISYADMYKLADKA